MKDFLRLTLAEFKFQVSFSFWKMAWLQVCFSSENRNRKMISLASREFFRWILTWKMDVEMNLRIISKNHAADPEKRSLTKSISTPYGRATAMPPAWELKNWKYWTLTTPVDSAFISTVISFFSWFLNLINGAVWLRHLDTGIGAFTGENAALISALSVKSRLDNHCLVVFAGSVRMIVLARNTIATLPDYRKFLYHYDIVLFIFYFYLTKSLVEKFLNGLNNRNHPQNNAW